MKKKMMLHNDDAAPVDAAVRKIKWRDEIKRNWQLYVMLIVPLSYMIVFKYFPMVGAQIAFRDYLPADGIWKSEWVGLKHFIRFFSNPQWKNIVKNTVALSVYSLILSIPFPIILAIALDYTRNRFYRKTVQMATFCRTFLSTVIIVSMMILYLITETALINILLK